MTVQPDEFEAAYSKAVETGWDSVKDLAWQIWDEARAQISQGGEAVAMPATVEYVGKAQGHGHVTPRADGVKARCGGPTLCRVCQKEQTARYTHPADQVAEGVVVPETWQQRLKRMNPTVKEGKWPKRWVEEAKDDELRELRALLAKSEGVKP